MTALLASVRSVEEAVLALSAGADIIDLKEPNAGALGALPQALIAQITARVRQLGENPVSATIGDLAGGEIDEMARRVGLTARAGVDFVKVGIAPGRHAGAGLRALADLPVQVVPLFLADDGIDLDLIALACAAAFPIVMVDTQDKRAGSLFDCVAADALRDMIQLAHAAEVRVGLAGSLRVDHVPILCDLEPDIAGFRGALCDGSRTGTLVPGKVRALRAALPALRAGGLLTPVARGL